MTRKRWLIVVGVAAVAVVAWLVMRKSEQGHRDPADAMAAGWAVYQAGIDGWLERGPDGESYMHDSGWQRYRDLNPAFSLDNL